MLRVEASNLPKPRGTPRARRLLPTPPLPRRNQVLSRHELLPPPDDANPPVTERALLTRPVVATRRERWSVRLELGDDEIAKLYGQGMTRGAVVWKKGMVEWRPLLITPELSGLLRRTRTTLIGSPAVTATLPPVDLASSVDEFTLPRPARLPNRLSHDPAEKSVFPTLAPLASDIDAPTKPGRPIELLAVAAAAFALAWIGHAKLHPQSSGASAPPAVAAATAPVCEATQPATKLASLTIPTIAVADLPLAGATNVASTTASRGAPRGPSNQADARTTSVGGGSNAPSRSDLVGALSQVARAASSCGERSGPVRIVVSFTNSGVARSIQVSGNDLPASTRSCIIGAASRARVPEFSGDPVTVAKTL